MTYSYTYKLGFKAGSLDLPDPTTFTGADSALDTSAERDSNGLLHRVMVATKHPLKIGWNNIGLEMAYSILTAVKGAYFSFTYPDPSNGGALTARKCYAGDRSWEMVRMSSDSASEYMCTLSFSVIEY